MPMISALTNNAERLKNEAVLLPQKIPFPEACFKFYIPPNKIRLPSIQKYGIVSENILFHKSADTKKLRCSIDLENAAFVIR